MVTRLCLDAMGYELGHLGKGELCYCWMEVHGQSTCVRGCLRFVGVGPPYGEQGRETGMC